MSTIRLKLVSGSVSGMDIFGGYAKKTIGNFPDIILEFMLMLNITVLKALRL
jgi:hypothetical protein